MSNTPKPQANGLDEQAYKNTDVELWREPQQDGKVDYYSNSIHRTDRGGIGINVGGSVHVMTLEEWHKLAQPPKPQANKKGLSNE